MTTSGADGPAAAPGLPSLRARAASLLRSPVRRALDRVSARVAVTLAPQIEAAVQQAAARLPATPTPAPAPLFATLHELLHAQRGVELSRMPAGARVLLSAGCSGRWYFDWVEREYGAVERHIGIEKFMPRPDDLPANVEWVAASVAHMPEVPDASVDLVFSGQNIEHLFGDDTVGFLLESARVLRPGGHLVMDSPHREIARDLVWSMNEHTIEYTPAEAAEMVRLAGFEVTSLRGIWLCRDPDTGAVLPLDPYRSGASAEEVLRRVQLAARHPDHSFTWWLEARRADRAPDGEALRRLHGSIFARAWPERANRLVSLAGSVADTEEGRVAWVRAGTSGYLVAGPYMPLAPAHYDVGFTLRRTGGTAPDGTVVATLEVTGAGGESPLLAGRGITAGELPDGEWRSFTLSFDVAELRWTGEFRVRSEGVVALEARLAVSFADRGSPVWPSVLPGGQGG